MKLNVCLVTGDDRTPHCGVKDYAARLAEALQSIGLSAQVMAPAEWGAGAFVRFCRRLREMQFDIVHLQYPSIGTRASLGPHLIGLMNTARSSLVTVHEYTAMPRSQRASMHLFRLTADRLVFTSETERQAYGAQGGAARVIPIGSNLDVFPRELPRNNTVLYFGQIRPGKGLEEFMELARLGLSSGASFHYCIAGTVPPRREEYYRALRSGAPPEVEWLIDLPAAEVSEQMARAFAAYLPFEDGASYRRGSLIAALSNGVPVVTTVLPATPSDLARVVLPAFSAAQALAQLETLCRSPEEAAVLGKQGRTFAKRFCWTEIARQHEQVYLEALAGSGPHLPVA